jgi:hypothetical protein
MQINIAGSLLNVTGIKRCRKYRSSIVRVCPSTVLTPPKLTVRTYNPASAHNTCCSPSCPLFLICRRRGLEAFLTFLESQGIQIGVFSDYPVLDKLQALGLAERMSLALLRH